MVAMFLPFLLPLIKFTDNNDVVAKTNQDNTNSKQKASEKSTKSSEQDKKPIIKKQQAKPKSQRRDILYRVSICSNEKGRIPFWTAFIYYHTAPMTKFMFHTVRF